MMDRYTILVRLLRSMTRKCYDGIDAEGFGGDGYALGAIGDYLRQDAREALRLWPPDLGRKELYNLANGDPVTEGGRLREIVLEDIPTLEDRLDDYFAGQPAGDFSVAILEVLHPRVIDASYGSFRQGRYRDAVFNAVVAVYDMIRDRVGLDADGVRLIGEVFSLENPKLIFSNLHTDSGRSDQKGFLQIFQGVYVGIRNPKAHTLQSDLDERKAAQYLVLASLLARRVDEAKRSPETEV